MFKDYKKYLTTSLKVYLFVLIIIVILKLMGLDYFGINKNSLFTKIIWFLVKYRLDYMFQYICLYVNFYLIKSLVLENYKVDFETFLIPSINNIGIYFLFKCNCTQLYPIFNILILIVYFAIKKAKWKRVLKVFIVNIIIQFISSIIRNYDTQNYDTIVNSIMNIDYYIALIIWYKLEKRGGVKICQDNGQEVGSYLQKKMNLKNLLKRLQTNLHNFKLRPKEERLTIIIYLSLSLIWNIFTIIVVLLVARLNQTFIECIFILTSFWLSKKCFGRPFHLKSMLQCFIVSNLTYYTLNRITTPIGVSIIIPIMLGVGLSYITSKFTKKLYKPLYRGMPKELFKETILKVLNKDSIKYKICYEYYIDRKMAINLALKYSYSEAGIRKILKIVNKQIKELNK